MASSRRTGVNENVATYGDVTRDYQEGEFSVWEAATDYDLVSATQSEVLEIYDDAASFDDYLAMGGTTTSSSYLRIVRPADGEGNDGTPLVGVTFSTTGNVNQFYVAEDYSQVQDINGTSSPFWASDPAVFRIAGGSNAAFVGCIAFDSENRYGANGIHGFQIDNHTAFCINCLAHNIEYNGFNCATVDNGETAVFSNCTSTGNAVYGFNNSSGTGTMAVKNGCSSGNTSADWNGTISKTTCTSESANPTYVDADNDDFHLDSEDTVCKDNGTDLSSDSDYAFNDDVDGETRSGTWDIGFDDVGGAASSLDKIKFYYNYY